MAILLTLRRLVYTKDTRYFSLASRRFALYSDLWADKKRDAFGWYSGYEVDYRSRPGVGVLLFQGEIVKWRY
jgi:hypothetical protein